ncbi:hypothetical protein EVAR_26688_1 [Eumeta japonica]|uniref:Uncharacterized protein n=1 Tax=Eumeta variegata TaxID=151549 RepID=A0A4C1VPB6_EUMVA|nr:hypothetical protein EVAR_26688_1 [Eumeta japonica]
MYISALSQTQLALTCGSVYVLEADPHINKRRSNDAPSQEVMCERDIYYFPWRNSITISLVPLSRWNAALECVLLMRARVIKYWPDKNNIAVVDRKAISTENNLLQPYNARVCAPVDTPLCDDFAKIKSFLGPELNAKSLKKGYFEN